MRNCPPDSCKSLPGKLVGRAHEASATEGDQHIAAALAVEHATLIEIVAQVIAAGAGPRAPTGRFGGGGLNARLSRDHARNIPQRIPGRSRVDVVEELSVKYGQARLGRRDPSGAADRPMCGPTGHLRASMLSGVAGKRSASDQDEQGCGRSAVQ
jgi:hypothetical protein